MSVTIDEFKSSGSELDRQIELLVARRLINGSLTAEDQMLLDRLVAKRAGRMLPSKNPHTAWARRYA